MSKKYEIDEDGDTIRVYGDITFIFSGEASSKDKSALTRYLNNGGYEKDEPLPYGWSLLDFDIDEPENIRIPTPTPSSPPVLTPKRFIPPKRSGNAGRINYMPRCSR